MPARRRSPTTTARCGTARSGRIRSRLLDTGAGATQRLGIAGTATFVSAGVWDLAVTDESGAVQHLTLSWNGDDLTMTGGNETVVIEDYVNGTFGITLEHVLTGDFGNNSLWAPVASTRC